MNKGTILIVQPDILDPDVLRDYFEKTGYRVLTICAAEGALALARYELPQAIILDVDTPGVDAAALVKEVRDTPRTRHIHITLLTPLTEREDKLTALSAGADEFLSKPVDVEELGLRIRNALRRASFENLTHPITGLPGPRLIEEQLRDLLRRSGDWAILRLFLQGFKPFGEIYGFLAGEEVQIFAAHMFGQIVDRLGTPGDFIGHGSDDSFIIIVSAPDKREELAVELKVQFDEGVKMHYSFRERERGYMVFKDAAGDEQRAPLMSLSVRAITPANGPFSDIYELTQALG